MLLRKQRQVQLKVVASDKEKTTHLNTMFICPYQEKDASPQKSAQTAKIEILIINFASNFF
jgi:hypothetical protein